MKMSLREKRVSTQLRVKWQQRCDPTSAKLVQVSQYADIITGDTTRHNLTDANGNIAGNGIGSTTADAILTDNRQ